jgi:hypothetical protein
VTLGLVWMLVLGACCSARRDQWRTGEIAMDE